MEWNQESPDMSLRMMIEIPDIHSFFTYQTKACSIISDIFDES